jgi:hypothetical protein
VRKWEWWVVGIDFFVVIAICMAVGAWHSAGIAIALAVGFACGAGFQAASERKRREELRIKVVRLENFKKSAEALCGKIIPETEDKDEGTYLEREKKKDFYEVLKEIMLNRFRP